jgi:hypothetical protein
MILTRFLLATFAIGVASVWAPAMADCDLNAEFAPVIEESQKRWKSWIDQECELEGDVIMVPAFWVPAKTASGTNLQIVREIRVLRLVVSRLSYLR